MAVEFRIRPAVPADIDGIVAAHDNGWATAYSGLMTQETIQRTAERRRERWERTLASPTDSQEHFVAIHPEDGVAGFVTVGVARPNPYGAQAEVFALYLRDDRRGQGIGRKLVVAGAEWLMPRRAKPVLVWVLRDNPYRGFYERIAGTLAGEKEIEIGPERLVEYAYLWRDAESLHAGAGG